LRAKPEPTQLHRLSDASFLGKLLVLPANVRLDCKVFARCKHFSLFGLVISNEDKKFYHIDTWSQSYQKLFSSSWLQNKLQSLSLTGFVWTRDGTTKLSIMTFSIMTLSIMILSIMTFIITAFSIIKFNIIIFRIITFSKMHYAE
jgi:hypothetical protein